MSISIQVDVFCDICNLAWEFSYTTFHPNVVKARRARKNMKRLGWTTKKIDGKLKDVCPKCKEEIK